MIRWSPLLPLLLFWTPVWGVGQESPPVTAGPVGAVHQALDAALAETPAVERGALVLAGRNGVITQRLVGRTREDTRLPLLDSSAWWSAATLLTLVDRGDISLTATLGEALPEVPADKVDITLQQLLDHTSGIEPQHPCLADRESTLEACARAILETPLRAEPGREIFFGATGLQVAGWWAERVTGRPWAELVQERLSEPLGLACLSYGTTTNPHLARGARACTGDVARFLTFLLDPKPLLGPETAALLLTPQGRGARSVLLPDGATGLGFGTAFHPPWVEAAGAFSATLSVHPEGELGLALLFTVPPQRLREMAAPLRAVLLENL
jgi:CubicO group peptidase (beta-lactamase class C family)